MKIEEKLWKELEAVKMNIVYMNYKLWYYQVLYLWSIILQPEWKLLAGPV